MHTQNIVDIYSQQLNSTINWSGEFSSDLSSDHDSFVIWTNEQVSENKMQLFLYVNFLEAIIHEEGFDYETKSDGILTLSQQLQMKADLSPADLSSALRDLAEVEQAAVEEDDNIPSEIAIRNALRLLLAMYDYSPQCFQIYPLHDGEIAIDAPGGHDRSVALVCESDGSVLCMVNFFGRRRYARYSDANTLPDQFIYEALYELRLRKSSSI